MWHDLWAFYIFEKGNKSRDWSGINTTGRRRIEENYSGTNSCLYYPFKKGWGIIYTVDYIHLYVILYIISTYREKEEPSDNRDRPKMPSYNRRCPGAQSDGQLARAIIPQCVCVCVPVGCIADSLSSLSRASNVTRGGQKSLLLPIGALLAGAYSLLYRRHPILIRREMCDEWERKGGSYRTSFCDTPPDMCNPRDIIYTLSTLYPSPFARPHSTECWNSNWIYRRTGCAFHPHFSTFLFFFIFPHRAQSVSGL